jgi:triacylglycerol esterase/lipase EstA (alpha/beta hydrolase family)
MKKYFILCLFLIHYSLFFAQQTTYRETILAPPEIMDCASPRPIQNQIIYGANINSQKPVLVFVHGFFDTGYGWFALSNKMYKNAFDNGYRTAFLMQPQNNPVLKTGEILAKMIAQVKSHYGVNQVIAIVHSKGALDIESAMYIHNMESSIQNVIAVSGSFHGAVIADISTIHY